MNIIDSLLGVAETLEWSLFLAGISIFLYIAIKTLQNQRDKKASSKLESLRNMVVMAPFLWMILNFDSDPNYIADTMFGFWLPLVIMVVFTIGLTELILPIWYDAKAKGSRTGRVLRR